MVKVGKTFEEAEEKSSSWKNKYPRELTVSSSAPCLFAGFGASAVASLAVISVATLISKL